MALERADYVVAGSEGISPQAIEYANSLIEFQKNSFRMSAGVESFIPSSDANAQSGGRLQQTQGESSAK